MTGNIIGEEFYPYVINQIQSRQKKHGTGIDGNLRSYEDINYLSNRNAWIKMASSVDVRDSVRVKNINLDSNGTFSGINLAKKAILFNTLVNFKDGGGTDKDSNDVLPIYKTRSGVSSSNRIWNNSAYGLGGSDFGLQPPPGIISVSIDTVNRGSIRKATVKIKAYNKFQFELIELLYLRLGFTMMLEWGWDKYINDNTSKIESMGNTLIENWWFTAGNTTQLDVLKQIEAYRERYCGNYDGFFGKVSNYNWKFQSDGSYDISINLITVGDVIESLQARVASTDFNIPKTNGNPLILSMGNTTIDKWLYNQMLDDSNFVAKSDYIMLKITKGTPSPEQEKYKYYVSFGEFINQVSQLCIPTIKNGDKSFQQLSFDEDASNIIVKVFPNQISIDPRICLFEPYLSNKDFKKINSEMESLKPYTVSRNGIIFGQLMNLYLNFDFIIQTLKTNVDKNGKLSLYRFLEGICDGINSSLGGVNKIQPIIKNDNVVTFIDQALQSSTTLNQSKKDTAHIEVYGYNMNNNTSNFIKNIDFQTKLSKETAAMISIGATAGGDETSIKNGDATAFSKWNEGLEDRFCRQILDPSENPLLIKTLEAAKEARPILNRHSDYEYIILIKFYGYKGPDPKLIRDPSSLKEIPEIKWNIIDPLVSQYKRTPPDNQTLKTPEEKAANYIAGVETNSNRNLVVSEEYFSTDSSTSYIKWLIDALGGSSVQKISIDGSSINYNVHENDKKYFVYDSQFVEKGKSLYKAYIAYKARVNYSQTKNQSSQIGFLPLEFTLTADGISGMKIYNKLNISQHFLPSNYPTSFDFVVVKLNHKIDNMGWETEIGTLSTSNIDDKLDEASTGSNLVVYKEPYVTQQKVDINKNILRVAQLLKQKNLNKIQVAAAMGNISVETAGSFNPLQKQNGGPAIGLFQWEPKWYSKDKKTQEGVLDRVGRTIESQIDFIFVQGSPDTTGYKRDVNGWIKETKNYTENEGINLFNAVNSFEKKIEGAGKPNINSRLAQALYFYNQFITVGSKLDWNKL